MDVPSSFIVKIDRLPLIKTPKKISQLIATKKASLFMNLPLKLHLDNLRASYDKVNQQLNYELKDELVDFYCHENIHDLDFSNSGSEDSVSAEVVMNENVNQ